MVGGSAEGEVERREKGRRRKARAARVESRGSNLTPCWKALNLQTTPESAL